MFEIHSLQGWKVLEIWSQYKNALQVPMGQCQVYWEASFLFRYATYILGRNRKVTKWFVHCFIKLNSIFFLHIVNIIYVILEWIYKIWTKFSEVKPRHVSLMVLQRLARYLNFWVLCKVKSGCGRERVF